MAGEGVQAPTAAGEVRLRPSTASDLEFLEQVYARTREQELKPTGWSDEQKAQFCRQQFEAQATFYRQNYPGAQFFVIQRGELPAGRLYVMHWPGEIRIMDIALLPEHRGSGIGTRLLNDLQAEARAACKSLSIHVERFNPALRLYERLGFQLKEDKGIYLLLQWTAAAG